MVFGLAVLAIGGVAIRPLAAPWLWGTCLIASFTAVHVVDWSDMRMRAPLMPLVCLAAAAGWQKIIARRGSQSEDGAS